MHDEASTITEIVVLPGVFFGILALHFSWAGSRASARSTRLANFSLFCVVIHLLLLQIRLGGIDESSRKFIIGAGFFLGVLSVGLAIFALILRSGSGRRIRPFMALVLSSFLLLVAIGSVLFNSFTKSSALWIYQSPDAGYRITLSSECKQQQAPLRERPRVWFACWPPQMQAAVLSVRYQKSEADFEDIVKQARTLMESKTDRLDSSYSQQGVNLHGNRYHYSAAIDNTNRGSSVFVAHCFTWKPVKQIIIEILFEAPLTMISTEGQNAAMTASMQASNTICKLVE